MAFLFEYAIVLSTLLCSLVAGFVFSFTIVVMPGLQNLGDRAFLQAFQAIDGIIQRNQPIFVGVWLGSAIILPISTLLAFFQVEGIELALLVLACTVYLLGVQVPTMTINVPLNNRLQTLALETLSSSELLNIKAAFTSRWLRWNTIRTLCAILTTILLLILLFRY
nr:anthrone oxygenase family protein [uncultured Desulfobulbus sp.]